MFVIDEHNSVLSRSSYANLEKASDTISAKKAQGQHTATGALPGDKVFSKLHPRQKEGAEASYNHLEMYSLPARRIAMDMANQLPRLVDIMTYGSHRVAVLFRQSELAKGLEVLQDVIAISRELLVAINVLRAQYCNGSSKKLYKLGGDVAALLGTIIESMSKRDWALVADLLDYEYMPICEGWRGIIRDIKKDIATVGAY